MRLMSSFQDYVLQLVFINGDEKEDTSPSLAKVQPLPEKNAFLVRSIQGIRLQITRRLDERGGYDVTRIGQYRISSSSIVYVSDPVVMFALRPDMVLKSGTTGVVDSSALVDMTVVTPGSTVVLPAAKGAFGPAMDSAPAGLLPMGLYDISETDNPLACHSITIPETLSTPFALIARRGICTFVQKMRNAALAGASAVIILSDEEELLVPSADPIELVGIAKPVPLVLLPKRAGETLLSTLASSGGQAMLQAVQRAQSSAPLSVTEDLAKTPVIVNGHHLVNCRLVLP
jgi:mannosidase alpha-like ER degradation enhancer 1